MIPNVPAALIIPVSHQTCVALAEGRAELGEASRLALPPSGALSVVLSTSATRQLAARLGIRAAPGVEACSVAAGLAAAGEIGFPVVVTPDDHLSRAGGRYAADGAELARCLTAILRGTPAYLEPPLQGEGVGLAVLCRAGAVLWAFQYRRLHELGPIGSVSAYRVSEAVDPVLLECARRLMRELGWDGAAELHFRRDAMGSRLTKVTPTFADATAIAVAAGADAPAYLHDLRVHDRKDFPHRYRIGAGCRHLPSEVAWARQLVRPRCLPARYLVRPPASRVLAETASALSPWHRWETQSIVDPAPGVQELRDLGSEACQSVSLGLARAWRRGRMRRAARHPKALTRRVGAARTIVFVCVGNIIRSAFAAALLRTRSRGLVELRIESAGLYAATDHPADVTAARRARRFGADLSTHRSRRVDEVLVAEADLVFAMEIDHVIELCRRYPQYRSKVYLFGCLADDARDVADPLDAAEDVFDECFDRIDRGIRCIVAMQGLAAPPLPAASEAAS